MGGIFGNRRRSGGGPGGWRLPLFDRRKRPFGEAAPALHGRGWKHRRLRLELPQPAEESEPATGGIVRRRARRKAADLPLTVVTSGPVSKETGRRAGEAVRAVARTSSRPVLHGRVVLSRHTDPAVVKPAEASAMLDVNGTPVHVHVAAGSMRDAVDLLEHRLRRSLETLDDRSRAVRRTRAPGEEGREARR